MNESSDNCSKRGIEKQLFESEEFTSRSMEVICQTTRLRSVDFTTARDLPAKAVSRQTPTQLQKPQLGSSDLMS
jgi:hypothetical protein